jgi:subtilisin family serine protease
MRSRTAALAAAALASGALVAAPAHAFLPNVCGVVPSASGMAAMVAYGPAGPAAITRVVTQTGGHVTGGIAALHVVEAAFPTRAARDAALPLLRASGARYAEPERVYTTQKDPNDPYLRYQWGIYKTGVDKAWAREKGTSSPVTVAVIDTGVDMKHPDLTGRVTPGKNVVDNTDDPTDDNSHGTHVAGIVAARSNNLTGVAGISWGAQVLAVKVLGADGAGTDCDVAYGMVSAVQAGARILNLSLGAEGAACGGVQQAAVDYATKADAVTIVAAGNNAKKGNKDSAPADCAGVLAVGATDARDKVAPFSAHHPYVAISAPGVMVMSTYYDPKAHRHGYAYESGTSMATPFVAGVAALVLAKHPTWTPQQVMDRLTKTADDRGVKGRDQFYGTGRINAARALAG